MRKGERHTYFNIILRDESPIRRITEDRFEMLPYGLKIPGKPGFSVFFPWSAITKIEEVFDY